MSDHLFNNIFGEGSNKQALQKVTTDFPYFSTAHFFLLKDTLSSHSDHSKVAGRTGLHFNNPFYLNYLLAKKEESIKVVQTEPHPQPHPQPEPQPEPMIFEPLYTTDYFASQGIKLSDEIKPDDKLGKQLKSFTDWLKTMKKVHEQRLPAGNEQLDLVVQNIAEKSNKEAEIITESMAEVYISQGKPAKAREIYQKLSLFNPSKSAYFAAKSENLNT